MYYPVGWPRILRLPPVHEDGSGADIRQVVCNRDKILCAILTSNALQIWYIKVSLIYHELKLYIGGFYSSWQVFMKLLVF